MEKKSATLIYKRIFWFVLIVAILLLFIHWKYSLCALGVLLWNYEFYKKGCQELVVDEWEYVQSLRLECPAFNCRRK